MAEVLLSVGSNIERDLNIRSGLKSLALEFGTLALSPVYESEAIGFQGDNFYNLVVAMHTALSVGELSSVLKSIENKHGRDRSSAKFSARTLDIDILTYDQQQGEWEGVSLPRDEIKKNAFVLLPMADLRPNSYYPGSEQTYKALWERFDSTSQKLWVVPFPLNVE